jgi:2-keto-4-pentenoate hydratase/2-oxohepta-3-ene-1,7-dioic acid hydratase in catechol pathway
MRLATFSHAGSTRIGIVDGDAVVDLTEAEPDLPREMTAFLAMGSAAMNCARHAVSRHSARIPLGEVHLAPPILRPPKFLGIGLNYADHAAESGRELPAVPTVFNKQPTCVTGPYDLIHIPRVSATVDYEGELGFVVGRRCRHVPREQATEVIAGYLVVNDVSVREWQWRTPTWTMGKGFDTHGPIGPWIVTPDEIGDPHALRIRTWVNEELRQDSSTRHLIFDCFALVEHFSTAFTLEPGDIVTTGTPAGVGGMSDPPRFLVPGDVVRIAIDGIGEIENRVIAEPPDTALL